MTDARLRPPWALGLVSVVFVCLLIFIAGAGLVVSGNAQAFDEAVLTALRSEADAAVPIGPDWLHPFARELTGLAGTPVLTVATIALAGWFAVRREWRLLVILLAAVLGETLLSSGLKSVFDRPRPDLVPHLVHATGPSYPSGHATSASAIYLTLAALIANQTPSSAARSYVFGAASLLALLVGASRVYLGVHYPTDVIGGLALGAAWAAIVWIAARTVKF
ncbi:MAG: phosphatase PAP2 family protein [Parvularculaceae bacterium]|nr:phosphatase PAP2 family protein [Parvularculaceae bacterium]